MPLFRYEATDLVGAVRSECLTDKRTKLSVTPRPRRGGRRRARRHLGPRQSRASGCACYNAQVQPDDASGKTIEPRRLGSGSAKWFCGGQTPRMSLDVVFLATEAPQMPKTLHWGSLRGTGENSPASAGGWSAASFWSLGLVSLRGARSETRLQCRDEGVRLLERHGELRETETTEGRQLLAQAQRHDFVAGPSSALWPAVAVLLCRP